MVKKTEYKKSELLQILSTSNSLKEINRAVKLLKKFDPYPRKHLDSSFETSQATVTKYSSLQSFLCWRCDKIKQTMTKVKWETKEGLKIICTTCYTNLSTYLQVAEVRRMRNKF